jgi:hypothetical protein
MPPARFVAREPWSRQLEVVEAAPPLLPHDEAMEGE